MDALSFLYHNHSTPQNELVIQRRGLRKHSWVAELQAGRQPGGEGSGFLACIAFMQFALVRLVMRHQCAADSVEMHMD